MAHMLIWSATHNGILQKTYFPYKYIYNDPYKTSGNVYWKIEKSFILLILDYTSVFSIETVKISLDQL